MCVRSHRWKGHAWRTTWMSFTEPDVVEAMSSGSGHFHLKTQTRRNLTFDLRVQFRASVFAFRYLTFCYQSFFLLFLPTFSCIAYFAFEDLWLYSRCKCVVILIWSPRIFVEFIIKIKWSCLFFRNWMNVFDYLLFDLYGYYQAVITLWSIVVYFFSS